MSVQVCEGVFRQKCGRYVAVISCERREGGQLWTDGLIHYFNDGTVIFAEGGAVVDLVEYIGPFPYSHPAETESTTAVAGSVCDDPGRIIFDLKERMKTANAKISCQTAENERLQANWQTEFTAAQQLRSENERLQAEIERLRAELRGYAAESHRQLLTLQASHDTATATLRAEQRGEREGFRIAISMILEASR